jgi:hypothetical protein
MAHGDSRTPWNPMLVPRNDACVLRCSNCSGWLRLGRGQPRFQKMTALVHLWGKTTIAFIVFEWIKGIFQSALLVVIYFIWSCIEMIIRVVYRQNFIFVANRICWWQAFQFGSGSIKMSRMVVLSPSTFGLINKVVYALFAVFWYSVLCRVSWLQ